MSQHVLEYQEIKHLTGNISLPKSVEKMHGSSPLKQHKRKCSICKHDLKDEIERKIKTLSFKTSDYDKYGIAEYTVKNHIKYLNLFPAIEEVQQLLFWKSTVRCNDDEATVSNVLALGDQANKMAGVYQADKREPLDTAITEMANTLLNSRLQPMINRDGVPQSQTEIDTGIKKISVDKSMD